MGSGGPGNIRKRRRKREIKRQREGKRKQKKSGARGNKRGESLERMIDDSLVPLLL